MDFVLFSLTGFLALAFYFFFPLAEKITHGIQAAISDGRGAGKTSPAQPANEVRPEQSANPGRRLRTVRFWDHV